METGEAKYRSEWFVRAVFETNVGRLKDGLSLQESVDNVREHTRELSNVVGIHDVRRFVTEKVELVMRCGYVHRSSANMSVYPYGLSREYDIQVYDLNNPS